MATAIKDVIITEEIVRTEVSKPVVVLTLTPEEAAALKCLMQKVGGSPDNSIRGPLQDINIALSKSGVAPQPGEDVCDCPYDRIYFKDDTRKELRYE